MHPVESFLYYTAATIPCLWGGHPILAVTAIIDLGIAAWLRLGFKFILALGFAVKAPSSKHQLKTRFKS